MTTKKEILEDLFRILPEDLMMPVARLLVQLDLDSPTVRLEHLSTALEDNRLLRRVVEKLQRKAVGAQRALEITEERRERASSLLRAEKKKTEAEKKKAEGATARLLGLQAQVRSDMGVVLEELLQARKELDKERVKVEQYSAALGQELILEGWATYDAPPTPEDLLLAREGQLALFRALDTLTARERKVLGERYFRDLRQEEMGKSWEVTKERIRQIEAKALRKLRHPSQAKNLERYTGAPFAKLQN